MTVVKMTAKQQRALLAYANALRVALGLRDWKIEITPAYEERDLDDGSTLFASCSVVVGRRYAFIAVAPNFFDEDADVQRLAMVHELLHIYVNQTKVAVAGLADVLPRAAYSLFSYNHETAIEFAVDGISTAVAHFFPLPDLPRS